MKINRAIFTYSNFQIDPKIQKLQQFVIEKLGKRNYDYKHLYYNAPDPDIIPSQVIDYGVNSLFDQNYDSILLLDVDCIPLSVNALNYIFERAEQGILIGNAQRSNHIKNNQHVYPAPSALCFTYDTYLKLGKPSFNPTDKGDTGEELSYIAEQLNIDIEMFLPNHYEDLHMNPDGTKSTSPWDLSDNMPKFSIGTTFIKNNGEEMFYHLFQCRVWQYNHLFFKKCEGILNDIN